MICGFAAGIRNPSGMNTLGVIVATLVSLLVNEIVTPPGGALIPRLTAKPAVWPGATTGGAPMLIKLVVVAVIDKFAELAPVADAVIVEGPEATPVMVNEPDAAPCAIVTVPGDTVTEAGLLLSREIARPPEGAGCPNAIVPLNVRPTPTSELAEFSVIVRWLTIA